MAIDGHSEEVKSIQGVATDGHPRADTARLQEGRSPVEMSTLQEESGSGPDDGHPPPT